MYQPSFLLSPFIFSFQLDVTHKKLPYCFEFVAKVKAFFKKGACSPVYLIFHSQKFSFSLLNSTQSHLNSPSLSLALPPSLSPLSHTSGDCRHAHTCHHIHTPTRAHSHTHTHTHPHAHTDTRAHSLSSDRLYLPNKCNGVLHFHPDFLISFYRFWLFSKKNSTSFTFIFICLIFFLSPLFF